MLLQNKDHTPFHSLYAVFNGLKPFFSLGGHLRVSVT